MYNFITCPKSNRKYKIKSKIGMKILNSYLNQYQTGSAGPRVVTKKKRKDEKQKKIPLNKVHYKQFKTDKKKSNKWSKTLKKQYIEQHRSNIDKTNEYKDIIWKVWLNKPSKNTYDGMAKLGLQKILKEDYLDDQHKFQERLDQLIKENYEKAQNLGLDDSMQNVGAWAEGRCGSAMGICIDPFNIVEYSDKKKMEAPEVINYLEFYQLYKVMRGQSSLKEMEESVFTRCLLKIMVHYRKKEYASGSLYFILLMTLLINQYKDIIDNTPEDIRSLNKGQHRINQALLIAKQ